MNYVREYCSYFMVLTCKRGIHCTAFFIYTSYRFLSDFKKKEDADKEAKTSETVWLNAVCLYCLSHKRKNEGIKIFIVVFFEKSI